MILNCSPFPELTTERLLLRQLTITDVEEIFLLRSDPIVNKHLGRPKANSIDDAKAFIEKIDTLVQNNQSLFWGICYTREGKLVGTICLWNFSEEENKAEIGYELLPSFHRKGIMQEAFSKVIEYGFKTLELNSIEAWTTIQNENSIRILERNHFRRDMDLESKMDKTIEGPDMIIYSLSKTNYLNSRP
jgi:[ribosomal protein S5]-alanine N-acetyltransferase